jgi:hypothetical protein
MRNGTKWIVLTTALIGTTPGLLGAQRVPRGMREVRERLFVGAGGVFSVPQGEFAEFVGNGGGVAGHLVYNLGGGLLGIRFDGSVVLYGLQVHGHPWGETRTDAIWFGGIGPQLTLGDSPFRPYLHAGIGWSYFATTWASPGYASTVVGHGTGAWYAGGGFRVELSRGRVPLSLDLMARYVDNGTVAYLAPNVVVETPDGLAPATLYGDANLMLFQVGLSVAIH